MRGAGEAAALETVAIKNPAMIGKFLIIKSVMSYAVAIAIVVLLVALIMKLKPVQNSETAKKVATAFRQAKAKFSGKREEQNMYY